jgi:hypothetical protein
MFNFLRRAWTAFRAWISRFIATADNWLSRPRQQALKKKVTELFIVLKEKTLELVAELAVRAFCWIFSRARDWLLAPRMI